MHIYLQSEKVKELHKKEVQLEVYIQENEELLNVKTQLPKPLRTATSEELLNVKTQLPKPLRTATSELFLDDLPTDDFPQKTTSMQDVQVQCILYNSFCLLA